MHSVYQLYHISAFIRRSNILQAARTAFNALKRIDLQSIAREVDKEKQTIQL